MIYIAGKGDGNVRYYELLNEEPYVFYLSQFISGAPQRGFGVVPKRGCVTAQCEIFRFYKLHATKDIIEPISMIVPRKSESFQDDIYPETQAPVPSLTGQLNYGISNYGQSCRKVWKSKGGGDFTPWLK